LQSPAGFELEQQPDIAQSIIEEAQGEHAV
jgi:hypothetical protein